MKKKSHIGAAIAPVLCGLSLSCTFVNLDAPDDAEFSSGCFRESALEPGLHRRELEFEGDTRGYYLWVPDAPHVDYPFPTILAFGPAKDSCPAFHQELDFAKASAGRAILIYPEPSESSGGEWEAKLDGEDLRFAEAARRDVRAELCVDESRQFVVGHQDGGRMAHAAACAMGEYLRGVAMFGNRGDELQIEGGQCRGEVGVWIGYPKNDPNVQKQSMVSLRDFWQERGRCKDEVSSKGAHCSEYASCKQSEGVLWCPSEAPEFRASRWPGWASESIWNFFQGLD